MAVATVDKQKHLTLVLVGLGLILSTLLGPALLPSLVEADWLSLILLTMLTNNSICLVRGSVAAWICCEISNLVNPGKCVGIGLLLTKGVSWFAKPLRLSVSSWSDLMLRFPWFA